MSPQPPERAAGAATPAGDWPDPDWPGSREDWAAPGRQPNGTAPGGPEHPGNGWPQQAQWPAGESWGPQDPHITHEEWPSTAASAEGDWTSQPDEPEPAGWPPGAWGTGGGWPSGGAAGGGWPPGGAAGGGYPPGDAAGGLGAGGQLPQSAGGAGPAQATREGPEPGPEPGPVPPPHPAGDGDPRWVMVAYLTVPLFSFLVPLAVLLASHRSPWARAHAAQALNTALTVLLYDVSAVIMAAMLALDSPMAAVTVAGLLVGALWVTGLVHLIRAAGAAGRGEDYRMPAWLCATLVR